jgi:hypothetical protein
MKKFITYIEQSVDTLTEMQIEIAKQLELRRYDYFPVAQLSEAVQLLVEDRLDFIKQNLGPKIKFDHDHNAKITDPSALIDHIAQKVDPTPSKAHTQWVSTQYAKGHIAQEDFPRVKKALKGFELVKKNLVNKDINAFKTIADLEDHVAVQTPRTQNEIKAKETKNAPEDALIKQYESEHGTGFKIPSKTTSIKMYGPNGKLAQARWCTSANSTSNAFNNYEGGKYTFHTPENHVLQIHHKSGQIMDVNNTHINLSNDHRFSTHKEGIKDFIRQTHAAEGFTADNPSTLYKNAGIGMTHADILESENRANRNLEGTYKTISRSHLESLSENPHTPEHFENVMHFIRTTSDRGWYQDNVKAEGSLAQNPNTPVHILKELHEHNQIHQDAAVSNGLAANKSLPEELKQHYKEFPEYYTRHDLTHAEIEHGSKDSVNSQYLVKNNNIVLHASAQDNIMQHDNTTTRHQLQLRPELEPHIAGETVGMVAHKATPEAIETHLSKLPHMGHVNTGLYNRDDIPAHVKERLVMDGKIKPDDIKAEHSDLAVKGGAYSTPHLLKISHLSKENVNQIGHESLSKPNESYYHDSIFNHKNASEELKVKTIAAKSMSRYSDGPDKFDAFENIKPNHIDAILATGDVESSRHVPGMKNVQKHHFDEMLKNKELHGAIVKSKSAPPSVLSKLASTSTSDYIKSKVAAHKNTPADVKASIKFDESKA